MSTFVCPRFGLSTFGYVEVLVCKRFGLSTFWSVDVSVCQRFGLSTFWLSTFRFVDVLTSYLQRVQFKTSKPGYKMAIILRTTYPNSFLQWHFFYNFAMQEFCFLKIICILLYTDLISSIFFQHCNISTRASHHWCLASNIVRICLFDIVVWRERGQITPSNLFVCDWRLCGSGISNERVTNISTQHWIS